MYCGHISSFIFGIFFRLSNGALVICDCMQIFSLVSNGCKLNWLSFVGQHEHAVSRFHIIHLLFQVINISLISGFFSNFCKNRLNKYAQTGICVTQWL